MDDGLVILIAMSFMCRRAYAEGLSIFTDDERKVLMGYWGYDPKYLPKPRVVYQGLAH